MLGRPFVMGWREEATRETLHAAYRRQPKGEVRTRLQGRWLLRQGWRLEAVAGALGGHYRTVPRWVRWYREGGRTAVSRQHGAGHGQPAYLTPEQEAAVQAEVATGRFHTAAEVRQWVAAQYGLRSTAKGIYRLRG